MMEGTRLEGTFNPAEPNKKDSPATIRKRRVTIRNLCETMAVSETVDAGSGIRWQRCTIAAIAL